MTKHMSEHLLIAEYHYVHSRELLMWLAILDAYWEGE
jgi:hypothetical protein